METLMVVGRLFLGLVFAISALSKARDVRGFGRGVEQFKVLSPRLSRVGGIALIMCESIVGFTLLTGWGASFGLLVCIALIFLFASVMIRRAEHTQPLPCYCFGSGTKEILPLYVLLRLAFLGLVVIVIEAISISRPSFDLSAKPERDTLLLAIAAVVLGSWLLQLPELIVWHRTPVPKVANLGNRLSLRHVPIEPIGYQESDR